MNKKLALVAIIVLIGAALLLRPQIGRLLFSVPEKQVRAAVMAKLEDHFAGDVVIKTPTRSGDTWVTTVTTSRLDHVEVRDVEYEDEGGRIKVEYWLHWQNGQSDGDSLVFQRTGIRQLSCSMHAPHDRPPIKMVFRR